MKKALLYLFLFTYSTVMFKPVMPHVADVVAHILFYHDHMQTVHEHHGETHAHAAVAEGAREDQSQKSNHNFKKDTGTIEFLIHDFFAFYSYHISTNHASSSNTGIVSIPVEHDFPPPRI